MNSKVLQDYIKGCERKDIVCTWEGLKAFYEANKTLYKIA